jgi:hypothetical protein
MKAVMDANLPEIGYIPTTGVTRMHEAPLMVATDTTLKGYGCLVDDIQNFPIEIVRWPAHGRRAIERNSGNQGGVAEKLFEFCWKDKTLHVRHRMVGADESAGRVQLFCMRWVSVGMRFNLENGQRFS